MGIDHGAAPQAAAEVAGDAMSELESVLEKPDPVVVLKRFGDSAIVLECRFWIDNPSAEHRWQVHTSVVEAVKSAFDREEIKIPFPQRELMGRSEVEGRRLAGGGVADASGDGADPSADGQSSEGETR